MEVFFEALSDLLQFSAAQKNIVSKQINGLTTMNKYIEVRYLLELVRYRRLVDLDKVGNR